MSAKVYFNRDQGDTAAAVEIDGTLLPVVSGTPVVVEAGDMIATRMTITVFAQRCEFISLASEEVEALASLASVSKGGAK